MKQRATRVGRVMLLLVPALGCAELQRAIQTSPSTVGALDADTIAEGLREALLVGSERAVESTSAFDGFLADELIRIAIPDRLRGATDTLRRLGFDEQVDELEIGMNRAAERASAEARDLFWDAIRGMTIGDAYGILRGEDDAATQYLRQQTGTELRSRVQPIVESKMQEVGLSRAWKRLGDRLERIPLLERPAFDLDAYVTDGTLDGIFTVLAGEERRIRDDPLARTTELLQQVFR